MRHEIGLIVQEDKDPAKIRKALANGCGGVIVDNPVPDAVIAEFNDRVSAVHDVLRRLQEAPLLLQAHADSPDHLRWSREEADLSETCRWLAEEFKWAAEGRLCQKPKVIQRKQSMLRLWLNEVQNLPWHIDLDREGLYPDIHMHVTGAGLKVAVPPKPLKLLFSENRTSPHLQLPGLSLMNIREKNPEKILRKKLDEDLRERHVEVLSLQPGQMLFFNEKCLHISAPTKKTRLRAGIF